MNDDVCSATSANVAVELRFRIAIPLKLFLFCNVKLGVSYVLHFPGMPLVDRVKAYHTFNVKDLK